ncbi:fasciclin domain-containing protein [Antarcticibacterium flavum]|uniref:Fasciclin domain-containing protein n=1 Tax=Antarcticibacterium flavum TaxID=2058175 RepID=A0A5B7X7V8_9FLAO|nr:MULTISPECIES: fasciclin domain-containing protein [Antarcticibacterium]MCM4159576.1 beta-Ig-H3/fasciclin [Antarcticibacterium sp. W02-3]QCY70828.1 fasciclin domain-containing protein [Antarcticibacterium flavum]
MKIFKLFTIVMMAAALSTSGNLYAQSMKANKNIVETASGSADHTTLVAAVKAADLAGTLQSEGPFTVFAPTNAAFEKLPAGTVETLLKPENKKMLQDILTYHVVAGDLKAGDVVAAIKKGNGTATLETVNGGSITAMMDGNNVKIKDAAGNVATVTAADLNQSNGVIHVLDTVLLPGN